MAYTFAGQFVETILDGQIALNPGKTVSVKLVGTSTLATIYTDRTKADTTTNPVTIDAKGNLSFFADPGQYDLRMLTNGVEGTPVTVTVPIDPEDAAQDIDITALDTRIDVLETGFVGAITSVTSITDRDALTGMVDGDLCYVENIAVTFRWWAGSLNLWIRHPYEWVVHVIDFFPGSGTFDAPLDAALARSVLFGLPDIIFPPGIWPLSSMHTISEAAGHEHRRFIGQGDHPVRIVPPSNGRTPAFYVSPQCSDIAFKNLSFSSGRAVRIRGTYNVSFENCAVVNSVHGASPIQVINSFWVTWKGHPSRYVMQCTAGTPAIELIGDISGFLPEDAASNTYLFEITDTVLSGGGIRYVQDGPLPSAPCGYVFENIDTENYTGREALFEILGGFKVLDAVVTSGSTTVTSATGGFTAGDIGRTISGTGIPFMSTVVTVPDTNTVTISAPATLTCPETTVVTGRFLNTPGMQLITMRNLTHNDAIGGPHPYIRSILDSTSNFKANLENVALLGHTTRPVELCGDGVSSYSHRAAVNMLVNEFADPLQDNFGNTLNQFEVHKSVNIFAGAFVLDGSVALQRLRDAPVFEASSMSMARFTTALRPSAVTYGDGAQIYDTDLNKPLWSDGAVWRDATGAAV